MKNKLLISTSIISIMCCLSAHAAERLYIVGAGETLDLAAGVYENIDATNATEGASLGYGSIAYIGKGTLNIASGTEIINNKAKAGGAITNNAGVMTTGNVLFKGNKSAADGGAVYNTGTLNIGDGSTFSDNSGVRYGGALFSSNTLILGDNITFSGNTSNAYAGAIYNGKTLTIGNNATFSGNTGTQHAGAIMNNKGVVSIGQNAIFSGNVATNNYGGAIYNSAGDIEIGGNATFSGNTAKQYGGAIFNSASNLKIGDNATFANNEAITGGAMYIYGIKEDISLNKATFKNNIGYGGAINLSTGDTSKSMFITNSLFEGNATLEGTGQMGGAIFASNGNLIIKDTNFIGNKADFGGALVTSTGASTGVFVSLDNVLFKDNEAQSTGAVGNYAGRTSYDKGGMIIKNSRFINNKATATIADGGAGAMFLGSDSMTELDNVIFDGNSSASEGGAIGVRVSTGKGNLGSLKIANSTFSNNTAATKGGAIDNYFQNFTVENTTFTGNSANEGGAIYNHAEPDKYGNVGTLTLGGDVAFKGNTANGELNDIYNASKILVAQNATLSLDGGISGVDGTTEFASGTVLNVKQDRTKIENLVSSDGTTLNITLVKGAETLDLDDIFTHAGNADNLENFHVNQKNALYTLTQNAENASLYDISINSRSDVADILDITDSAAGAILTLATSDTTGDATLNAISDVLHDAAQSGDMSVVRAAENLGANTSTLVQSRETMHSNMLFAAVDDELNSAGGNLWVRGLFNYANQDGTSNGLGFDANTYGVAAGIDTQLNKNITAGVGYAYSQTSANGDGGLDTDIDSNTLMAYGQYKTDNWYTNIVLAYGMSDYTENKFVLGYNADADYDVKTLAAQSMTGLRYKLGNYDLNPEVGLRYLHIARDGYTDKLGTKINSQDSDFLTLVAGSKFASDYRLKNQMVLRPVFRAAITYDAVSADNNAYVALANGAGYYENGETLSRLGFEIGAHLALAVWGNTEFSAGYEGKFRSDYQEHAALLNAKYKF